MKEGIHPSFIESTIKCACGYEVKTTSMVKQITVDVCSNCHPFYTGKQKLLDTAGRIEKFQRKYAKKTVAPVVAE